MPSNIIPIFHDEAVEELLAALPTCAAGRRSACRERKALGSHCEALIARLKQEIEKVRCGSQPHRAQGAASRADGTTQLEELLDDASDDERAPEMAA
ncbi:hypothetical protein [Rhizobium mongolense]|uniref:Uncharacterized protein n=1 Tax=Rhizobium mongolense TaxID=57676 RepID=A0ABR6IGI5_9HYPH|nr:hypothetical protein [Rhizobium mongolense]